MKWLASRTLWGILLILGGVLFLLDNLNIITFGDIFWGFVLGIGGVGFLSVYFSDRQHWWALIPGMTLLAVAVVVFLSILLPAVENLLGGAIVLGGIALSFILIYLINQEHWWAIIPGGVLTTLALITLLDEAFTGIETGGILFLGLGLTFALVAILPNPHGQMRWAYIPAGILFLMGLLIMATATQLINYLWPVALILVGLYFVFRTVLSRS